MNLHENKQFFQDIINEVSYEKKISIGIIEKDYYVTLFLKELIALDQNYIFKGGTSLSKGFKIIHRFSEDIDLNYPLELLTTGGRKRIKRNILSVIQSLNFKLINEDEIRSRRTFNRYRIDYASIYKDENLKPQVIVETAFQTESYPVETVSIQTIISEYLEEKGLKKIINEYDLKPFCIHIQSIERTFVDKVFALCDYYISSRIEEHSRHIYDIFMILNTIKLDTHIIELFCSVKESRKSQSYCYSAQDGIVLSNILDEIIVGNCYKDDYNKNTKALCYDNLSYEEAIKRLEAVMNFLRENNM